MAPIGCIEILKHLRMWAIWVRLEGGSSANGNLLNANSCYLLVPDMESTDSNHEKQKTCMHGGDWCVPDSPFFVTMNFDNGWAAEAISLPIVMIACRW